VTRLDVVTPADRPQGRGARALAPVPVRRRLRELADTAGAGARALPLVGSVLEVPYGLRDLSQWAPGLAALRALGADLGVVVSFGYFLPAPLLDTFRLGAALNMHPSLLPRHRGAAPVPHTILAGDAETGVSVIDVHRERFDAGRVLLQRGGVRVGEHETSTALTARLAAAGADAVEAVLLDYDGHRARATAQDAAAATRAPKLLPAHGLIAPGAPALASSAALVRTWRALESSVGLHCFVEAGGPPLTTTPGGAGAVARAGSVRRLNLLELSELPLLWCPGSDAAAAATTGEVLFDAPSKTLALRAADGAWVRIVRLQPEFKREMRGDDFGRGLRGGLRIVCKT
jgi:methionyl-tRNA formyltransferase